MIGTRATPSSAPRTSTINPHLILANGSARPSQPPPPPPAAADIRPTQPHADNSNQPRSQPQSQLQLQPLQSRPPHRKSGGGKVGRKNWTPAHIETLLKLVESHCPIGRDHWEMISQIFNVGMEPPYQRSASQLKEKYFGLLHGRGMKKDNPQFQQYAIKAREIERLIEHKYQIVQSSDPFASHTTGGSESWNHGDGVVSDLNNEEGWNEPMEADETLTQPPPIDDSIMALHAPASTASTAAAAAASSSTAAAAAAAAAISPPPQLAPRTPPSHPQSSSSTSSPCSLSFTGKRRRSDLDRLISEALERDEQRRYSMEKAMVMMATAIAAMAQAAERRHEAAERSHEQLMALLIARKG